MIAISENQLVSAVNQVFARKKRKFCKADEMEQLLVEEGLRPEEAKQAISFARAKKLIRSCYPYIDEIHGDECYELLTEDDRDLDDESEEDSWISDDRRNLKERNRSASLESKKNIKSTGMNK